jgi:type II secretory pathway component PulJ
MTLVEMLIAMVATLILMAAVVQVFGAFGTAMTASRAALGTDARLRTAAARLRDDLAGVTVQMLPPRDPGQGEGYFEVIEGPRRDGDAANGTDTLTADIDDALLFTTRANGDPFIGRGPAGTRFESTVAEVAWFARPTTPATTPVTYTLYRRQLLVMGYVGASPFTAGNYNTLAWPGSWADYFEQTPCDISARRQGSILFPNTLGDLTRRESRFMHNQLGIVDGSAFPFPCANHQDTTPPDGLVFTSGRIGEDVVLTNVISFDVRVFDPSAGIMQATGGTALVPGDPAYASTSVTASGAYVDIGHSHGSLFSSNAAIQVGGTGDTLTRTYCTWSTHYEANGIDDDNDGVVDQGTDGLDNAVTNSLVDEGDEQETSPPYPYPLRGIEVRIRCYEPSSRQIRQMTVRQTFVPH